MDEEILNAVSGVILQGYQPGFFRTKFIAVILAGIYYGSDKKERSKEECQREYSGRSLDNGVFKTTEDS